MKPALIIGSTCVDVVINIDHLPRTAENLRPNSQSFALGGCAYNVAAILRLMGAPHTFITPVGFGTYGDYVEKQLTKLGVPIYVRVPDQENGCCYCLVEASGERTFLSIHGAEYTFQKSWMEPFAADDYGLTYVCGLEIEEATGENLVSYLEEHPQLEVCYAPGPRGIHIPKPLQQRMMDLHPLLHINEAEAAALSGYENPQEAALSLYGQTQNRVIVTLGEKGALCMEKNGQPFFAPSIPAPVVADTIGAGDAHIGAVIGCLTLGYPLHTAIAYANLVSAAVVSVKGASLPPELLPPLPRRD